MKKIMIGLLLLVFSLQSFADCRDVIQDNIDAKEDIAAGALVLGGGASAFFGMTFLAFAPPVGVGIIGVSLGGMAISQMSLSQLEKLNRAIWQAYEYQSTKVIRSDLYKLIKKIDRKAGGELTTDEIVEAIITSNENNQLCDSRSINNYSSNIVVTL
jgi:hypothetical protein